MEGRGETFHITSHYEYSKMNIDKYALEMYNNAKNEILTGKGDIRNETREFIF